MDALAEGTVVGGRYVVNAPIGDGAMGTVYRAKHARVGRDFAIKVLHRSLMKDPKAVKRFSREAELAGRLRHQNVVSVVDVGLTYNGLRYMAMELAPGTSLGHILLDGPLSETRTLDIAKQLCAGLAHAHELGLIHRDFKPDNVLVEHAKGGREVARIVDFGVAILREDVGDSDGDRLTTKGLVVGTPHYMAPEQARGVAFDHRVDIYALGLIMYEMLSGVLPFEGTGVEVAHAHVSSPPPPLRERAPDCHIDADLEAIVMRMLAKDPSDRYDNADEVLQALQGLERRRSSPRNRIVTDVVAPISRAHSVSDVAALIVTEQVEPLALRPTRLHPTPLASRSRTGNRRVRRVLAASAVCVALSALLVAGRARNRAEAGSAASIDVASNESIGAGKDERIHRETLPPGPQILEQKNQRAIVEVPLPPTAQQTLPTSNVVTPSAQEVARLYATVGRELHTLEAAHGMNATIDLWPRYRWIRINDAMATAEKRMQSTVMLQRLQRDIRSAL
ncbi:MAG TPA: serine/threonine-protein kinase [Kofleriaceae bacterium]|nr:serine/threonine-protein kinase [Kofleriaceae bacterium]